MDNVLVAKENEGKLTITKSALKSYAQLYEEILYTISLKNNGDFPLNDIMIYDLLQKELVYVKGSLMINGYRAPINHWDKGIFIGSLGLTEETNITFAVRTKYKPESCVVENKATAKYSYIKENLLKVGSSESNILEVKIVNASLLARNVGAVGTNDEIEYNIVLTNSGEVDLKNILLVDNLPKEIILVDKSVYINDILRENADLAYLPIGNIVVGEIVKIVFKAKIIKYPYCEIKNLAIAYYDYEIDMGITEYSSSNIAENIIIEKSSSKGNEDIIIEESSSNLAENTIIEDSSSSIDEIL